LRRALIAAALASAALAMTPAAGSGGAGEIDDARCDLDARATASGAAIDFRVRCSNIEPFQVKLRPSTGVERGRAIGVKPAPTANDRFACEAVREGKTLQCRGHMEDGAALKGRLRPDGPVCRTAIPWVVFGGVDCDGGEACIDIALADSGEVRRPRGC
jgi:hypothetical protein